MLAAILFPPIPGVYCASNNTDFSANWPSFTPANTTVAGQFCFGGWSGYVTRVCLATGQWAPTITGSCTRTCDRRDRLGRAVKLGRHLTH